MISISPTNHRIMNKNTSSVSNTSSLKRQKLRNDKNEKTQPEAGSTESCDILE